MILFHIPRLQTVHRPHLRLLAIPWLSSWNRSRHLQRRLLRKLGRRLVQHQPQIPMAMINIIWDSYMGLIWDLYTHFWTNKPKATCRANAGEVDTSSQLTIPGVAWLWLSYFHEMRDIYIYIYVVGHGTPMKHLYGTSRFDLRIFRG